MGADRDGAEDESPAPAGFARTQTGHRIPDGAALPVVERAGYEIGDELGRGGLGRVLRARDRVLGRPVALKELLARDGDAARFAREALITARLQHPSIVPVYQAGRWVSGE